MQKHTPIKIIIFFILLLILTAVSGYAWSHREEIISPCLPPLHYAIGTVDPQFGISREQFITLVNEATATWEKTTGKDLFVSDPNAPFTINLVYDERQSKTQESVQLEKSIASQKKSYDQLTDNLTSTKQTYDELFSQYSSLLKKYQEDLDSYQKEISSWNAKGGAPKDVYDELEKKRIALEKRRITINELAEKINAIAGKSQKIADTANAAAENINTNVEKHNSLFEEGRTFDKGQFNGKDITIYQFTSSGDLLLALTHEFGHALGIEHTDDPRSVMHYLLQNQPSDPVTLTHDDISAAITSCRFDIRTPDQYWQLLLSSLKKMRDSPSEKTIEIKKQQFGT